MKRIFLLVLLSIFLTGLYAQISIIFTHDIHSHFDPENYVKDGEVAQRGGFARMKTAIDGITSRYPASFIFDAGDFSMGTPYQTIFSTEAPELRLMGSLGFDATVLGNHEFDYRAQGLTDMLNAAAASGDTLPALVIANIDWEKTFADNLRAENARALQMAMNQYGVVDYVIIEKGGIKAAVFGLMGKSADDYAPESGLYFKNYIETAKEITAQIKANENADIIICLSHSGTDSNPNKSEDELLARTVPEIDVIISGHTHSRLEQPIIIGNTLIVSAGEHTYEIGHLKLDRDGNRFRMSGYELVSINENLQKDQNIEKIIMKFRALVDSQYLSKFGYSYDQILAYSDFSFTPIEKFGQIQGEDTLGNLIADSYIAAVKKAEDETYRHVDAAIVPQGVVRGSFTQGFITVADAFNVSSLGIGPDRIPGYPLVSMYLTGKELKTIAEIDISVSTLMLPARLYITGLTYTYNPNRLILNRVTTTRLMHEDGSTSALDNNKLYRVIGGLYSCQMLGAVEAQSFGLLKVTPKDADGNSITDFEKHIVYDGSTELKEWVALANYLSSFEPIRIMDTGDGTAHVFQLLYPQIPDSYSQLQGRKIEETSRSPVALLKNPNKIFFILLGVILFILAIVAVCVWLIVRVLISVNLRQA